MGERGSDRTTEQIRFAPLNSIFVWCGNNLYLPRSIAHKIGREDIVVVPRSWILRQENWVGRRFSDIVVDHAVEFTAGEQEIVDQAMNRAIMRQEKGEEMVNQLRDYVGEELEQVIAERDELKAERDELREAYDKACEREHLFAQIVNKLEEKVGLLEKHKNALLYPGKEER